MQNAGADPAVMDAINRGNRVVFFDIALGGGGGDNDNADDEGKPLGLKQGVHGRGKGIS